MRADRFWAKVEKTEGCWLWRGRLFASGYGSTSSNTPYGRRAHRVAYWLEFGEYDSTMHVLHRCDNPPCVNPAHLFLGTALINYHDSSNKGRRASHIGPRGEKSGHAKLTWHDVKTIRHLYFAERRSQRELGEYFGVSSSTIGELVRGETWIVSTHRSNEHGHASG